MIKVFIDYSDHVNAVCFFSPGGRTRPRALQSTNKIFLLNIVLLSVKSSKSLNNDCNMITDGHCYC